MENRQPTKHKTILKSWSKQRKDPNHQNHQTEAMQIIKIIIESRPGSESKLLPRKLTCPLKRVFQPLIFWGHVSFHGCIQSVCFFFLQVPRPDHSDDPHGMGFLGSSLCRCASSTAPQKVRDFQPWNLKESKEKNFSEFLNVMSEIVWVVLVDGFLTTPKTWTCASFSGGDVHITISPTFVDPYINKRLTRVPGRKKVVQRFQFHLGVSKNNGTPKSSILIGFSIINHPFWGTPIFGNIHLFTPVFVLRLLLNLFFLADDLCHNLLKFRSF